MIKDNKKLGRPYNTEILMTELGKYGYKVDYTMCEKYDGFMLVYKNRCRVCGGSLGSKSKSPRFKLKQDLVLWCQKNKKSLITQSEAR